MSDPTTSADDGAWEKTYAPRVSSRSVALSAVILAAWLIFLTFIAVNRWSGSLQ